MLNRIFREYKFVLLVANANCNNSTNSIIKIIIIRRLRTIIIVITKSNIK